MSAGDQDMIRHGHPPLPAAMVRRRAPGVLVHDANGQALGYFYCEEPGRRSASKLLTKDEARRTAVNFAKLLDLLQGGAKA